MARKRIMASLSAVVLATIFGLFLAAVLPMLFVATSGTSSMTSGGLQAAPVDQFAIDRPMRISRAPDLILRSGRLLTSPQAASKSNVTARLIDPVFELETTGPSPDALLAEPSGLGAAAQVVLDAAFDRLVAGAIETVEIRNGTIVVKSEGGVCETISAFDAKIVMAGRKSVTANGAMTTRGLRLDFEATSGLPANKETKAAKQPVPFKMTIKSSVLNASFDGKFAALAPLALSGQLDATIPQLWRFTHWLGLESPESRVLHDVVIKSNFAWGKGVVAFDKAQISMDGQQASGTLSIRHKADRPALEGTLAFAAFDLQPYLRAMVPAAVTDDKLAASWSSAATRFPLVLHADADVRLSTPKLQYGAVPLGQGAATLTIRSGKLHADIAELQIGGHKTTTQVTADMNGAYPRYSMRGKMDLANAGPFLAAIFGKEIIDGPAVAHVDLTGAGDTIAQVLRAASGKVGLTSGDGSRVPADAQALRTVSTAVNKNVPEKQGWGELGNGTSPIGSLDVQADILNGAGILRRGSIQSGSVAIDMTGRIDFLARQLDMLVRSGTLKSPNVQNAKTSKAANVRADLHDGAGIILRGPWENPAIRGADTKPTRN